MTESNSGSLGSFFHRSVERVASSKALQFISSNPKTESSSEVASKDELNKKQHRRAQVRKAQIEHRQRKENHIRTLEEEVADLRKMIETTEAQACHIKQENAAIKNVIGKSKAPITLPENDPMNLLINSESQNQNKALDPVSHGQHLKRGSDWYYAPPVDTMIDVVFDELLDSNRLQLTSSDARGYHDESGTSSQGVASSTLETPRYQNSATTPGSVNSYSSDPALILEPVFTESNLDVSTKAVNFILALEHPCRTHFRPQYEVPGVPDFPEGCHKGHVFMASANIYAHAPPAAFSSIYTDPTSTSWTIPASSTKELHELYQMSQSLAKEDWEITPVQAWFLLVGRLGVKTLMGTNGREGKRGRLLDSLKVELAKFVQCLGFGAVMNKNIFWDVVTTVINEEGEGNPEGHEPGSSTNGKGVAST